MWGISSRLLQQSTAAALYLGPGTGEFNSDDHYIYYYGQESLRRNGLVLIVNKESEMQYLGAI